MSRSERDLTLLDLGERAIVDEVLRRYCDSEIGSDCASLPVGDGRIVLTTDPVPEPAALVIGKNQDLYWRGWLLTIINASDLAAAAAKPIAFLAALEAPTDLKVRDFERFVAGIADACKAEGLRYVGGNLKEGPRLIGVGTAIGWVEKNCGLTRKGARPGDLIAIVGNGGAFWNDALFVMHGGQLSDIHASPLYKPHSQLRGMSRLTGEIELHAAIDNSDGLIPSLQQLCTSNALGAVVDLNRLPAPSQYDVRKHIIGISHQRLWLGWGDWNVVIAVPPEAEADLQRIAAADQLAVTTCGTFVDGSSVVTFDYLGDSMSAPRIESERFSADSWFSAGIDRYVEILRSAPLPGRL